MYAFHSNGSFLGSQTHSIKLDHSAVVDLSAGLGSLGVSSEIRLARGPAPNAAMLPDTTDFEVDRVLYRSNDFTISDGGRTSDSFCVKLLRIYSCSQRKLIATKQVK